MRFYVRLAMPKDREQVRALARAAALEREPDQRFDDAVFSRLFTAITYGNPTGFVVGLGDRLVGFALCEIRQFTFNAGLIAALQIIYVAPGQRGTRASAMLVDEFLRWGRTIGCARYSLGADHPDTAERVARFFERFGARRIGIDMVIDG